jgi:hypothetical protein
MAHWVQYHTPERMGYGIDEAFLDGDEFDGESEGYRFSMVSNKAPDDPRGDVIWVVGITAKSDSPVSLGWWFVVADIVAANHPDFEFRYVGDSGGACRQPLPVISGEPWYRQLLGMTHNFRDGLTEVRIPAVLRGLRVAAARGGCPQE